MQHLNQFAIDVLRLAGWLVLLAIVFVPLERLFALRPARLWRREVGVDLGYYFLNNLVPTLILAIPVAALTWGLHRLVPGDVLNWSAALPTWARYAAAIVVVEIGTYWGHRWSHEIPVLWRFHAVHHSAEHIDWLVNSRAHPLDMVFGRFCGLVPLYVLGLAQSRSGGAAGDMLPLVVTLITTFASFFVHINARWRFGVLEQIVATPAFHHWHHVRDEHTNKNYATTLPVLDRIFGTFHLPRDAWPKAYGIDTPMPGDLTGQLLSPLATPRPLLRDAVAEVADAIAGIPRRPSSRS